MRSGGSSPSSTVSAARTATTPTSRAHPLGLEWHPSSSCREDCDYADIARLVGSERAPRLHDLCLAFLEQHGERFRLT